MAKKLSLTPKPDPNTRATEGDNSAAVEEASRVQFLSLLSQYDAALSDLEIAKGPVKAAQKKIASITGLAKAAGVPKWRLLQRHDEMNRPPHENADNIIAEARERRWAGIITPEQLKMYEDKNTPQEAMDGIDWQSRGYRLGVLGRAAVLPEGLPPRFTQAFLEGHADAKKAEREAIAKAKAALENMPRNDDSEFEMTDEERAAQVLRPSVQEGEPEPVL